MHAADFQKSKKKNNNKHHKHKTWGGKMKVPDVKVWELKENLKMWVKMTNSSRQEGENDHNPIPYLIIEAFYIQCLKCIVHITWAGERAETSEILRRISVLHEFVVLLITFTYYLSLPPSTEVQIILHYIQRHNYLYSRCVNFNRNMS